MGYLGPDDIDAYGTLQVNFPRANDFHDGCVLRTVAHAISVAKNPLFAASIGWDGVTYLVNNNEGDLGAVTFKEGGVIAVAFDHESPRSPFAGGDPDWRTLFTGASSTILKLAEQEALQYMFQVYEGTPISVITSAFWGDGGMMSSSANWPETYRNGGFVFRIESLSTKDAIGALREEYGFDDEEVDLLRQLNERRTQERTVKLSGSDTKQLFAKGRDGEAESREILETVGFAFP